MINIRVIDAKTDKEEEKKQVSFRKVDVDHKQFPSLKAAKEEEEKQQGSLDFKTKKLVRLIMWAMHNGKVIEICNCRDDNE